MKVKICGITDMEAALAAVNAGADALGFVFAESKRKIEPEKARDIVRKLPSKVMKVGVFVNVAKAKIESIAEAVGLTHIQLHGDETPEFCKSLQLPVIKAIRIEDHESLKKIMEFPCEYVLLDGPKGIFYGGNGLKFDWSLAAKQNFAGKKIILAGGLTPDNVAEAVMLVRPYMVDVSSGVETDGKKDLHKVKEFLKNAKRT